MKQFEEEEKIQKKVFKDEGTQRMLNEPIEAPENEREENEDFLKILVEFVENKKIDLYRPQTLLNADVYNKFDEIIQGKIDLEAVNMLSAIREIIDLYKNGYKDTYQIDLAVHRLRNSKERLELERGDVFII